LQRGLSSLGGVLILSDGLLFYEILNVFVIFVHVDGQVFLSLLEDEDLGWRLGESANADATELVILEEGVGGHELPSAVFMHLLDDLVVPVVTHEGVASGEDDITTLLDRKEHFFE